MSKIVDDERYRIENGMLLFWSSVYSQWFTREDLFRCDGFIYSSTEKFMMMGKAKLFCDFDIYSQIWNIDNVRAIKKLGRQIKNFNEEEWDKHKFKIVADANYFKFSQNEELKEIMMKHKDLTLVEAAPNDKIWGIGLHQDDERAWDESTWQGENLLGKALMEARNKIILEDEMRESVCMQKLTPPTGEIFKLNTMDTTQEN